MYFIGFVIIPRCALEEVEKMLSCCCKNIALILSGKSSWNRFLRWHTGYVNAGAIRRLVTPKQKPGKKWVLIPG